VFWTVENPHSSMVWKLSPFIQLSEKSQVEKAVIDQCMFGLKDPVSDGFSRKVLEYWDGFLVRRS
jgi:hypothetical protein